MSLFSSSVAASAGVLLDVCSQLPEDVRLLRVPAPGAATEFKCPQPCANWAKCRFRSERVAFVPEPVGDVSLSAARLEQRVLGRVGELHANASDHRGQLPGADAPDVRLRKGQGPVEVRRLHVN